MYDASHFGSSANCLAIALLHGADQRILPYQGTEMVVSRCTSLMISFITSYDSPFDFWLHESTIHIHHDMK